MQKYFLIEGKKNKFNPHEGEYFLLSNKTTNAFTLYPAIPHLKIYLGDIFPPYKN